MAGVLAVFVTICVLLEALLGAARSQNLGVVGGNTIPIENAPYMALLYTRLDVPCGGVIVDQKFILTSATCCVKQNTDRQWRARVSSDGSRGSGKLVNIQSFVNYPDSGLKTNICLVKLAKPLTFNAKVNKIGLDDGSVTLTENKLVNLVGFGKTSPADEDTKRELNQVTLPIDGSDWCKNEIKRLGASILCAGDDTRNACYGDAGGALTDQNTLIGVLADASPDCKSRASRFSRISYYRQWILKIIGQAEPETPDQK